MLLVDQTLVYFSSLSLEFNYFLCVISRQNKQFLVLILRIDSDGMHRLVDEKVAFNQRTVELLVYVI